MKIVRIEVDEKWCPGCHQALSKSKFYKDASKNDGLQGRCLDCTKRHNSVFNGRNPLYHASHSRVRYARIVADDPEFNKKRYLTKREDFLSSRDKFARSVRGRLYTLVASSLVRAKKNGLPHDITLDWLLCEYSKQGGKCVVTGAEFSFDRMKGYNPFSPSLDKIDSSRGYTKDNVRLVITALNIALNQWGDDQFEWLCERFLKYRRKELTE